MQARGNPLAGLSIICIADNIASIEQLIHTLSDAGATVVAVRTLSLALAFSDRRPVDAVLVDLRDPDWG